MAKMMATPMRGARLTCTFPGGGWALLPHGILLLLAASASTCPLMSWAMLVTPWRIGAIPRRQKYLEDSGDDGDAIEDTVALIVMASRATNYSLILHVCMCVHMHMCMTHGHTQVTYLLTTCGYHITNHMYCGYQCMYLCYDKHDLLDLTTHTHEYHMCAIQEASVYSSWHAICLCNETLSLQPLMSRS